MSETCGPHTCGKCEGSGMVDVDDHREACPACGGLNVYAAGRGFVEVKQRGTGTCKGGPVQPGPSINRGGLCSRDFGGRYCVSCNKQIPPDEVDRCG